MEIGVKLTNRLKHELQVIEVRGLEGLGKAWRVKKLIGVHLRSAPRFLLHVAVEWAGLRLGRLSVTPGGMRAWHPQGYGPDTPGDTSLTPPGVQRPYPRG